MRAFLVFKTVEQTTQHFFFQGPAKDLVSYKVHMLYNKVAAALTNSKGLALILFIGICTIE